jgi:hypothetical protein
VPPNRHSEQRAHEAPASAGGVLFLKRKTRYATQVRARRIKVNRNELRIILRSHNLRSCQLPEASGTRKAKQCWIEAWNFIMSAQNGAHLPQQQQQAAARQEAGPGRSQPQRSDGHLSLSSHAPAAVGAQRHHCLCVVRQGVKVPVSDHRPDGSGGGFSS